MVSRCGVLGSLLLVAVVTSPGCTSTLVHRFPGDPENGTVAVDESEAQLNRVRWLIDNLGIQEWGTYLKTIDELARIGAPAVDPLIDALSAGGPRVRAGAAHALGAIGDTDAIPALRSRLTDDRDLAVRCEAAQALLAFEIEDGVPLLLETLTYTGPPDAGWRDAGLHKRMAAIRILEATYEQDLGYRPDAPPAERAAAARRWQTWWASRAD